MFSSVFRSFALVVYPIFEILICFGLGYSSSLVVTNTLTELKFVDGAGKILTYLYFTCIVSSIIGFWFFKFRTRFHRYIYWLSVAFLLGELYYLNRTINSLLSVDYIFRFELIILILLGNSFLIGGYVSSLNKSRSLATSIGVLVFSILQFGNYLPSSNTKYYALPMIGFLFIDLFIRILFPKVTGLLPALPKKNSNLVLANLQPIALGIFSASLFIVPNIPKLNIELLLVLISFAYLVSKTVYYFGSKFLEFRHEFLLIFLILFGCLGIYSRFSNLEFTYPFLIFLLSFLICYCKVEIRNWKYFLKLTLSFGIAISMFYVCKFVPEVTLYRYLVPLSFGTILAGLLFFIPKLSLKIRAAVSVVAFAIPVLSFSFPKQLVEEEQERYVQSFEALIPFRLTNLKFDNEHYVYYNINLPFESLESLPKKRDIFGKVLVLGWSEDPVILSYLSLLLQRKLDFVLVSNGKIPEVLKEQLSTKKFPLFSLHFPKNQESKYFYNPELATDWKAKYIQDKLETCSSIDSIANELDAIGKYSGAEMQVEAQKYKNLMGASFANYANYFYEEEDFKNAIDSLEEARKFSKLSFPQMEMAFSSLGFIIPNENNIPILDELAKQEQYREIALKRLFAIYQSADNTANALQILEELEKLYLQRDEKSELENIYLEKASIYLSNKTLDKANLLITENFRKFPNHVSWQRLHLSLQNALEAARYRIYSEIQPNNPEEVTPE